MSKHIFTAIEASDKARRTVEIESDEHGFTVRMDGIEETLVLDLDHGQLRVFVTNEHGDVPNGNQLGAIGRLAR